MADDAQKWWEVSFSLPGDVWLQTERVAAATAADAENLVKAKTPSAVIETVALSEDTPDGRA